MLPRHGVTIAINTPSVVLHANFGFRRTRVAILSHDQAASAPASSGFVKRCERPEVSLAVPLRRDPAGFFAWSSQAIPSVSHPVPGNWVAKSVAINLALSGRQPTVRKSATGSLLPLGRSGDTCRPGRNSRRPPERPKLSPHRGACGH